MSTARTLAVVIVFTAGTIAQAAEPLQKSSTSFDHDYIARLLTKADYVNPTLDCYECHSSDKSVKRKQTYEELGVTKRITTLEDGPWRFHDYHSQNYNAVDKDPEQGLLGGARAKAIGKLLYGRETDLTEDLRCVSCHSGHYKIVAPATDAAPPQLANLPGSLKLVKNHGVSCQACHGPAAAWETPHHQLDDWWKKSSAEKYAVGLIDVRKPITRAQVCLSCHVGNSREGKILTHEMYAAGHPPLQNFEIETFARAMPSHGIPLDKKRQDSPDAYRDWWEPEKLGDYYHTRSVLTASLVALRLQVQLMADEARWYVGGRDQEAANHPDEFGEHLPHWPELAFYDCAACHHELDADRRRQQRMSASPPGRPTLRAWPTALYGVVVESLDGQAAAADPLAPLREALVTRPFGNPRQVGAAADKLLHTIDANLEALGRQKIDGEAALEYLRAISRRIDAADFEEARQLISAARVIIDELQSAPGRKPLTAEQAAKIDAALAAFDDDLCLTLTVRGEDASPQRTPAKVAAESLEAAFQFPTDDYPRRLANFKAAVGQ